MKDRLKKMFAVLLVPVMIFAFCGCGGSDKAEEASSSSDQSAASSFAGELIDAQNDRLVVRGDDETMLFATSNETEYELGEESELCLGDKIEVDYHKTEEEYVADAVELKSHEEESLVFGGEVTELQKNYVTVQSESLTVVFGYGDKTKIEGDLTIGDSVTVTYEGNLSENPKAVSVVVIRENQKKTEKSAHGTVSETDNGSIVVSVDSAHACRFLTNSSTKITGDDTSVKVGDEVHVVYTGEAGSDPVAKSIKVKRNENQAYFVMDGVIAKVTKNNITIRTAKKSYVFKIVKDTRIKNSDYLKAGHKTTITYVGNLDQNPVAASIFCSKDTVTKQEKQKAEQAKKPGKSEKNAVSNETQNGSKEKSEAASNTDTAEKTDDQTASESKEAAEQTDNQNASGSEEKSGSSEEADQQKSDENADSEAAEKESADSEAAEKEAAQDTVSTEEITSKADDLTEAAAEAKAEGSVVIKAKGEIEKWGKNPSIFKIDGRATLKLDIKKAKISGGYIPKEGDQVVIFYDKNTLELIDLRLEYRPADAAEVQAAAEDSQAQEESTDAPADEIAE